MSPTLQEGNCPHYQDMPSIGASVEFFKKEEELSRNFLLPLLRFSGGWGLRQRNTMISGVTLGVCASAIIANTEKP